MQRNPRQQKGGDGDLGMLRQLGISLDPLQQLSGLVNLINQTQAPGIQQQQFGEEMDFRQLQGDRGYDMNQQELQQRQLAEQNNQSNFGQSYGLEEQKHEEQKRYNDLMAERKGEVTQAALADRQNNNMMDFAKLLLNIMSDPDGSGAVDPNVSSQYLNQMGPGMSKLINPSLLQQRQGPQLNTTNVDKNISNEAFLAAQQKYSQNR